MLVLGQTRRGGSLAALIVDGRLEDVLAVPDPAEPVPGAVLGARVARRMPKQNAAIVDLGSGRSGYLRDAGPVAEGAPLLVQVASIPEAGKAVPVSRRVLFKGRAVIHTPGAPGLNVSRRLKDWAGAEPLREALQAALAELDPPLGALAEDGGFIIRHAARTAPPEAAGAEARALLAWRARVERLLAEAGGPFDPEPSTAWDLALRELTDPLPDRIVADADAAERLGRLAPALLDQLGRDRLERFGKGDPLDHHGVHEALAGLASPEVALPSGGSIVVEATRAMVAVDVNTGDRFTGGAALTANLEAARELPRQLRLRGLGGQIAVDFAPVAKKDRRRVEDALKTSFRRDPVETSLAGWTPLGNFELSRKRERRPLAEWL